MHMSLLSAHSQVCVDTFIAPAPEHPSARLCEPEQTGSPQVPISHPICLSNYRKRLRLAWRLLLFTMDEYTLWWDGLAGWLTTQELTWCQCIDSSTHSGQWSSQPYDQPRSLSSLFIFFTYSKATNAVCCVISTIRHGYRVLIYTFHLCCSK